MFALQVIEKIGNVAVAPIHRNRAAIRIEPAGTSQPDHQDSISVRNGSGFYLSLLAGKPLDCAGAGGGRGGYLAEPHQSRVDAAASLYASAGDVRCGIRLDPGEPAGLPARHSPGTDGNPDVLVLAHADFHHRAAVSGTAALPASR